MTMTSFSHDQNIDRLAGRFGLATVRLASPFVISSIALY